MTRAARWVLPGMQALGCVLVARALWLALTWREPLRLIQGGRFYAVLLGLVAAGLVVGSGLRSALRDPSASGVGAALRWAATAGVGGWIGFLFLAQPFQRLWFDLGLGLVAGLWALLLAGHGQLARTAPRAARRVDLAAFGVAAVLVGGELGLRTWAHLAPSPLNARVGRAPGELIERYRCAPGQVHQGLPCNERGFYDEPFVRKEPGDPTPLVASIGDSFSVGMVPLPWHFTTVCEELAGVRVANIGVAGIGPAEYVSLLVNEALPLQPDLVLVNVFVGNDLTVVDVFEGLPDAGLRAWLQREQVLLLVLPERLERLRRERQRAGEGGADATSAERGLVAGGDRASLLEAFPWLEDPALEEPSYSSEAFLAMEVRRARKVCGGEPPSLGLTLDSLRAARRAAAPIPLRVMLIPDEFQVEDRLWESVRARAGRPLERDRPQRVLGAWLEREGIPFLDLLPVLRAVPPLADGRRHLYHLRDTHFNARGNRVVGEALAEFLR